MIVIYGGKVSQEFLLIRREKQKAIHAKTRKRILPK